MNLFQINQATAYPVKRSGALQQLMCPCDKCQTTSHIVNSCPQFKFNEGCSDCT